MKSFFLEAIKAISTSGTIRPSSKYLIAKCLNSFEFEHADVILEFGTGDGCFTEQILKRMGSKGRLISFEVNPVFCKYTAKRLKQYDNL
ncbi:MAG: rRNA adenine N-6-methyltransferase family protein, partial [Saprospiraceae bacterium]